MDEIVNKLSKLHLQDLQNEQHPSIFDENEDYNLFIVRVPVIEESVTTRSMGFILTNEQAFFYNVQEQSLELLENFHLSVHKVVNKHTDKLLKSFVKFQESVLEMEESLYANTTDSNFLKNWLSVKLEILKIEKTLLRATTTLEEYMKYFATIDENTSNHFTDLHEHLERVMRSATLQLSKLDYLYSFYNAKSNDKMNKLIYLLTIISAIFLPLNLMVGFFGMNTTGLPFTSGNSGTLSAVSLMALLVVTSSVLMIVWRKYLEK